MVKRQTHKHLLPLLFEHSLPAAFILILSHDADRRDASSGRNRDSNGPTRRMRELRICNDNGSASSFRSPYHADSEQDEGMEGLERRRHESGDRSDRGAATK